LLAELTDVLSDDVPQDLWLLSVGIDNNPWGQYQPLIPVCVPQGIKSEGTTIHFLCSYNVHASMPGNPSVGSSKQRLPA